MDQVAIKPPLERFINTLDAEEKAILKDYIKRQSFDVLSKNFDYLIGTDYEIEKADS
jgi:hypothetical protein